MTFTMLNVLNIGSIGNMVEILSGGPLARVV